MSYSKPLIRRPRHQRIQNLARRFVSPGEGERPIPVTQKPAFSGPRPASQGSLPLPARPQVPSPSPLSIYTFRPAPSGFKSLLLPLRCLLGTGPTPAGISGAFLVPPQSELTLTLSFLPYPCEQPFPSPNHSLHPPCACRSPGAQPQSPPRVSLPSWGRQTQGRKDPRRA